MNRLSPGRKLAVFARVWWLAIGAEIAIRRTPLPSIIADVSRKPLRSNTPPSVRQLRKAVDRTLLIGGWRPRCLVRALVLHQLLHEAGVAADVVIGLPENAKGIDAHAWVEVEHRVVGPWPGRSGHEEFARFGPGNIT